MRYFLRHLLTIVVAMREPIIAATNQEMVRCRGREITPLEKILHAIFKPADKQMKTAEKYDKEYDIKLLLIVEDGRYF